jgi:hypothetical protein
VDLSDDLLPPRRPLFFPVVIATVLLTIIAMSAGVALAAWHKQQNQDIQAQNPNQSVTVPTTPSAPECRPETQQAAQRFNPQGTLRIQLLLRTATSAVWICADDAGQLFYHANKGGENATWIENKTALILNNVQSDGAGGYNVTAADGTTFSINSKRLRIVHKDGRVEIQLAVS